MWFQNLGARDRLLRLGIGGLLALLAGVGVGRPEGPAVFLALAIGFVLTSLAGFSPVYRIAHWKTTAPHVGQPDRWDRY